MQQQQKADPLLQWSMFCLLKKERQPAMIVELAQMWKIQW